MSWLSVTLLTLPEPIATTGLSTESLPDLDDARTAELGRD